MIPPFFTGYPVIWDFPSDLPFGIQIHHQVVYRGSTPQFSLGGPVDPLKSYIVFWLTLGSVTCLCGVILFVVSTYKNRFRFAILSLFLLGVGLATLGFVKSLTVSPKGPDKVEATDGKSELVRLLNEWGSTPLSSSDVDRLSRSNEIGTNEWMRLLLYRIQIRKSLAALARRTNIHTDDSEKSLTKWINVDSHNLLLTADQEQILCKVRDDSHYFEWQEGPLPTKATIEELGKLEPEMLDVLIKDLNLPSPKVYKDEQIPPLCPDFLRQEHAFKMLMDGGKFSSSGPS
jgi:hypothetical protein